MAGNWFVFEAAMIEAAPCCGLTIKSSMKVTRRPVGGWLVVI